MVSAASSGEFLTPELVERLGRAAALWTGAAKVFVGRDTRASGVELEEAFARGVISAGGDCILGGILPTPAVALLALDLGVVISASHNPPEYNGVKFFDAEGRKLSDRSEEQIEELLAAAPGVDQGRIEHVGVATDSYMQHIVERFGSDLNGLRIVVDCANGAYSGLAPQAFAGSVQTSTRSATRPTATTSTSAAAPPTLRCCSAPSAKAGSTWASPSTATATACSPSTSNGDAVDGDQIIAILALDLEVDKVAVTVMTNLGFHALMRDRGIEVLTTSVGDRYVLEALQERGAVLGGEQSGHVIYLRDHVTGDGLAAGSSCAPRSGAGGSRRWRPYGAVPAGEGERPRRAARADARSRAGSRAAECRVGDEGRILVRPSGTEPLIRVLAEARDAEAAREACASIVALVRESSADPF